MAPCDSLAQNASAFTKHNLEKKIGKEKNRTNETNSRLDRVTVK